MWNILKKKKLLITDDCSIDMNNIPKHIGIIMDGNGRWAKKRKLPRNIGHKAGVEALRDVVKECSKIGVGYLTLYGFSTENWVRPADEVNALMKLLVEYLKSEFEELHKNDVVINNIGDITKLPLICQNALNNAFEKSKNNKGLVLNLAFNYGGRAELIMAFKKINEDIEYGKINKVDIDEKLVANYLYTAGMPDPDIIIRPSGEQRLSNFLLWQSAYSEFWYSDIYWPDFKAKHLHMAIHDYQKRDRRFGGTKLKEV
ncbi:isoprenyl transferase [Clostridium estertheticum]|uniref:Isoprenyl transferase n=1 Tax=Clostridium estertheticum TaxID=238834 RepID=A0AA47EKC4_9CLOT|nr:isoprenyl transferase [Clostridium estertheticum]MBU3153718.1 isoprenyl transferase [Clostridium estertheticum]MBU3200202.1 isoprenyl transferase [Clostridium estertheticum]WAG61496.1 isoprenyl transferase [Clostridium estertheticum]WAG64376.1 isoprenyl transferase [Clostridium estertheticum]